MKRIINITRNIFAIAFINILLISKLGQYKIIDNTYSFVICLYLVILSFISIIIHVIFKNIMENKNNII